LPFTTSDASMTVMDLPWTWHNPEDDTRVVPEGPLLPAPSVDGDWVGRQLSWAFAERAATVVLYGWTPLALDWLEREPTTAQRAVLWAMPSAHLPALRALGDRLRRVLPRLIVAPVEDRNDLPAFVSRLPYIAWSPAVLTGSD